MICDNNEKYLKKKLVGTAKSSTFAAAFGERGVRKRGAGSGFFDSLRPAQEEPGREAGRIRNRPPVRGASEGGTRETENKKQDNSTTKSLILAQDERWRQA